MNDEVTLTQDELRALNIHQRIQMVKKKVAYIKRDKTVTGGGEGYTAVTHDNVTAHVRPFFLEFGINNVVNVISSEMLDTGRRSKQGNAAWRYQGRFSIDFVNVDKPEEKITMILDAHADDYGDKAPGKALSYATKGAMMKLLNIESGDDDEGRVSRDEDPDPLSEAELAGIKAQIDEATTKDAVKAAIQKGFKVAKESADALAHAEIKAYGVARLEKMK